jgi:hypothetical protein
MKIMPSALRDPSASVTPVPRAGNSTIQSTRFEALSVAVWAFGLAIPRRQRRPHRQTTALRVEIHLQKSPY